MFIDFHSHLTSGLRSQSGEIKFNKKKIYISWNTGSLVLYVSIQFVQGFVAISMESKEFLTA